MIGAILCKNYGSKTPLIKEGLPISLLEIKKDYSIIEKQLFRLKYAGVNKVYILGDFTGKIKEKYGQEWNGIQIEYLVAEEIENPLYALNKLFQIIKEDVIIVEEGVVTDINFREMIKNHIDREVTMLITSLYSSDDIAQVFGDKIVSFQAKSLLPYYRRGGVYIISKEVFPLFLKYKEDTPEEIILKELTEKKIINAYKEEGVFWRRVDSQQSWEDVLKEYENKVDKPWGYEKVIIDTEKYLVKELYIMKGERTSYQYHEEKDETLHVLRGLARVRLEDREVILKPDSKLRLKPMDKHQTIALENTWIFEYSTPHPHDVVRLEDPYQR